MPRQVEAGPAPSHLAPWHRLYLERDGHAVEVVGDGASALAHVDARQLDRVLLDVMLPGRNGLDVCRAIRSGAPVPIILITARAAEDDRLRGFAAGADDYVTSRSVRAKLWPGCAPSCAARGPSMTRARRSRRRPVAPARRARLSTGDAAVKLTPVEARLLG